ncbi:uncharacterized protein CFAP92 [Gastrophryne carolinensis]
MPAPPKIEDDEPSLAHKGKKGQKHHKKVIEAPKAQNYFHFEYFLLPEDTEPTKVDVVMFGVVAKLYMEQESRLLKPWQEDDKIWLVWSHSVDLHVTKEVLMKALTHQIQVKMWDTKDKVSSKARFDRPKAFRVSHVKHGEEPEVKQIIMNQRKHFEESLPRPSFILKKNCSIETQVNLCAQGKPLATKEIIEVLFPEICAHINKPGTPRKMCGESSSSLFEYCFKVEVPNCLKRFSIRIRIKFEFEIILFSFCFFNSLFAQSIHLERKCLSLSLSFMPLLAGDLMIAGRLQESTDKILDSYITLALNTSFLSHQQRRELNPLVIRILSATSLPTTPTPIKALQEECLPVYCRYRFQDQPYHQTHGQTHGTHVFFRDINVIFAGTISPGELRESLLGPPIEIEVHDRDQRIKESVCKPSLFGMEPEDEKLSNVGLITSKRTVHNPFMERSRQWDAYGVARVSLSELAYGATYLNICVPIHSCEPPDPTGYQSDSKNGRILGVVGSVDGPQCSPLPVGHYLSAQSHLKIRVDLEVPLSLIEESPDCPFGRIICIFDYKNRQLFNNLIMNITRINSKALGLNLAHLNVTVDAFSRVSLTDDQKNDTKLDVITGVHIMDDLVHLFILEGLKNKAVKELWEALSSSPEAEKEELEILYNSEMAFHERLYKDLGVLLCHIHLLEPLSSLMNQPLMYIRDMVPPLCFQALSRLNYICSTKKLRDVIHSNLLPSSDMIHLLSREFGIPFNFADLFVDKNPSVSKKLVISEKEDAWFTNKVWRNSLDNHNQAYILWKEETETQKNKDYIKNNIQQIYQFSKNVRRPKVEYVPVEGVAVHNYSSHTFNSTDEAYRILRQRMAKEPDCRFTYSSDYQSTTVCPVDIKEELKSSGARYKEEWMTSNGFMYPGFKSSIDCNKHPKKPDDSRIIDLTKAWKENTLHTNIQQPTLSRDRWSWAKRHVDFELYKKPVERYSLSAPCPIHLADVGIQEDYKATLASAEKNQKMRFHRCLPQTELTSQSSNQMSRLEGLLKDRGAKLSLRKPGLALKPIPALAVMQNAGEPITNRGFLPGELKDHSLKWTENIIPRYNSDQQLRGKDFELLLQVIQKIVREVVNVALIAPFWLRTSWFLELKTMHNDHGVSPPGTTSLLLYKLEEWASVTSLYSSNHSFNYKRRIEDLTQEEKNSFISVKPKTADGCVSANKMVNDLQNILRIQSHTGFLLQIQ